MLIRSLTIEEKAARQSALDLASKIVAEPLPLDANSVGKLYCAVRDNYVDFKDAVIAIGVAFGELIVAKADFEWVRVTDEWGEETSLSVRGWNTSCHPISMVQKRLENRDEVDFFALRDETIRTIEELISKGNVGERFDELN